MVVKQSSRDLFLLVVSTSLVLSCLNSQFVLLVNAQTCEPWNGLPELCSKLPGYSAEKVWIYLPANTSLSYHQTVVSTYINIFGSATFNDPFAEYCNNRYLMLACASFLRPCETAIDAATGETVPLLIPRQPCRDLCLEYNIPECKVVANGVGVRPGEGLYYPPGYDAPISCFNETERNGVPFYLDGNATNTVNIGQWLKDEDIPDGRSADEEFNMTCNAMTINDFVGLTCEEPLEMDSANNRCAFECPLPAYSEEQYDNIKIIQLTFGWLSWVGSLLVALSYAVHPKLRSFPANLILMTSVATNIATFALILPSFATYEKTWCGVDGAYLVPSMIVDYDVVAFFKIEELLVKSELCSFQGFVLMFGFLSTTMWWVIISFNMFLTVYFKNKLPNSKAWDVGLQVAYHVVGWALPFVLTLVPTAADRMAFGPGDTFCFVSPEDNRAYFITFWALPVALALIIGLILFIAAIGRILYFAVSLGEGKKACVTYYRLGLFILIFMIVYAFIFAYTLRVSTNEDTIEDGYSTYFECLVSPIAVRDNSLVEDCTLGDDVSNYHLAALKGFAYAVLGFLLFLNFCVSEAVGKMWWKLFKGFARGTFPSSLMPTETSRKSKSKTKTKTTDKLTMSMESVVEP
ncbi:hypothetical protein QOT17_008440 [Balamuthia mandrillaris]